MDREREIKNPSRDGVIRRINPAGLGYLEEEQSGKYYAFTFDKIQGYRGEEPKEIGLKVGAWVEFSVRDEQVTTLVIKKPIDKRLGLSRLRPPPEGSQNV